MTTEFETIAKFTRETYELAGELLKAVGRFNKSHYPRYKALIELTPEWSGIIGTFAMFNNGKGFDTLIIRHLFILATEDHEKRMQNLIDDLYTYTEEDLDLLTKIAKEERIKENEECSSN